MIDVRDKHVLVVGLARSGRAAAQALRRRGAVVIASDCRPPAAFQREIRELVADRVGFELGVHREETFLRQDLIVVSPGVPWSLPALEAARQRGIPVIPEIELAGWYLKAYRLGITGTNGKTTTCTLVSKMLEASALQTFVGGNIGVPLITAADEVSPDSIVVAELSSFQLEAIRDFRVDVAVLLNVTPNHLDRHPSFEAYFRAKAQIFRNQRAEDFAVLNADDPAVMSLAPAIASRRIFFSLQQNLPEGVLVSDRRILYRVGNLERVLMETRDVKLRGTFNLQNVLAASAAACVCGADFDALRRVVRGFNGVEHRLEWVREIRGVQFYNDSKATSVDATAKALSAFDRGVWLILGGKDKGAPYAPLGPLLEGRVRAVLLIGAAAARIAEELSGAVPLLPAGDLESAVRKAFESASSGDVVLLAPACASFDQFQDFEHRGRCFKEIVGRLAQESTESTESPEEEDVMKMAATETPVSAFGDRPPGSGAGDENSEFWGADATLPDSGFQIQDDAGADPDSGIPKESEFRDFESQTSKPLQTLNLEPLAPSPEPRLLSRLEPIFFCEAAAEEFTPPGGPWSGTPNSAGETLAADLRPVENIADKPILFEVRSSTTTSSADFHESTRLDNDAQRKLFGGDEKP